jgi:biopolymer transport protein ExbB/TolQ
MKPKRIKSLVGLLAGFGLMVVSPLIGMAGTLIGMHQTFSTLGQSDVVDANQFSKSIGTVLSSNIAALTASIAGFLMFGICLIIYLVAGRIRVAPQ